MNTIVTRWKQFRTHYWLSLGFDLVCLLLVLWAIHAWQTRALPIGEPTTPTHLPLLSAVEAASESAYRGGRGLSGASKVSLDAVQPGSAGVIYFFAPWCGVCKHSIDNLDAQLKAGSLEWATAIALDYANTAEVSEFVRDTGIEMPVLLGSNRTAEEWGIRGFPTYFVIDSNGNISSRSVGYSTSLGIRLRVWLAGFS